MGIRDLEPYRMETTPWPRAHKGELTKMGFPNGIIYDTKIKTRRQKVQQTAGCRIFPHIERPEHVALSVRLWEGKKYLGNKFSNRA